MKRSTKPFTFPPAAFTIVLLFMISCVEENPCDNHDYALPEISIVDPAGGIIVFPSDWDPPMVKLHIKADGGLNTLTMLDPWGSYIPIQVFTNGETELDYNFEFFNAYEGECIFVIHDLCNQRAEVEAEVVFE